MALDRRCCARPSRAFRASLQRGLGWRGPALWASGVSESRHEGAAGRTTWMPVVGLADETSERGRLCGISLVRSSRRQPSTTECPGGDDLPQGGVAHRSG